MAIYTPNLNLKKPSTGEKYDVVADLNDSKDKIDIAIGNHASQLAEVKSDFIVTNTKADTAGLKADAMASGSPKGVYATLAALQTAYPTGTTGAYLVTADGKWYYWSGTAWAMGGTYQSTGIADKTITVDKTDFISSRELNLFNKGDITNADNMKVDPSGLVPLAGYFATHYIPVTPGKTYTRPNNDTSVVYDASKQYVRIIPSNAGSAFVIQPGEFYVRLNIPIVNKQTAMFSEGALPSVYQPYRNLEVQSRIIESLIKSVDIATKNRLPDSANLNAIFSYGNYWVPYGHTGLNRPDNLTEFFLSVSPYSNDSRKFAIQVAYSFTGAIGTPDSIYYRLIDSEVSVTAQNSWTAFMKLGKIIVPLTIAENSAYDSYGVLNVLGDSLTDAANNLSTIKWCDHIKTWLDIPILNNYGLSGSCVGDGGVSNPNPMSARYSDMSANGDLNLVFGGVNDYGKGVPLGTMSDRTISTYYGALHVLLGGLITKYTSKKIGYIGFHKFGAGWSPIQNGLGLKPQQYLDATKEVCNFYSIPFLNLFEEAGLYLINPGQQSYYTTDGLHLNDIGQLYIAKLIYKWVKQKL